MATTKKISTTPKTTPQSAIGEATADLSDSETETVNPKIETVVRRKELVDRIAAKSGKKPNLIKSVLDAVLLELGDALSNGETIRVQPLGKLSVNRRKELPDGEVIVCKLRRRTAIEKPAVETPAIEAAE